MNNLEMINRLKRMDILITMKSTGTPIEFAEKLSLSVSTLYDILLEMKELGAPIKYSRICRTYFYEKEGGFNINFEWRDQKD